MELLFVLVIIQLTLVTEILKWNAQIITSGGSAGLVEAWVLYILTRNPYLAPIANSHKPATLRSIKFTNPS